MISDLQRRIIRRIQSGLPLAERPFEAAAGEIGINEGELLAQIAGWKDDGTIRRFGAIIKHGDAGYAANALGAWDVPEQYVEAFGRTASSHRSVSHCYLRPRFDSFPYNLYTMIHGRSREECEVIAGTISEQTGVTAFELLYTTKEYKKTSPVYFSTDEETR